MQKPMPTIFSLQHLYDLLFYYEQPAAFPGKSFFAMVGITVGGLLNIALDPLFIFTLDMGTAGAALATGLSQFISFCILLWMCNHQDSCISISIRKFRPKLAIYREVLYGGIPSLGRQELPVWLRS